VEARAKREREKGKEEESSGGRSADRGGQGWVGAGDRHKPLQTDRPSQIIPNRGMLTDSSRAWCWCVRVGGRGGKRERDRKGEGGAAAEGGRELGQAKTWGGISGLD
jgi:hypothetical protein